MSKTRAFRRFCATTAFLIWVGVCSAQQIPQSLPQDEQAANPPAAADGESSSNGQRPEDSGTAIDLSGSQAQQAPQAQQDTTVQYGAGGDADRFYPNFATDDPFTQLGAPTQGRATAGVKLGPFVLANVGDNFFYVVDSAPGEPKQTLAGDSLFATIGANKQIGNGSLNFLAKEQFSVSGTTPLFNQVAVLGYSDQLTPRWSLSAGISYIFFQNYILANPQYLFQPSSNGFVQQSVLAQQLGNTSYIANNFSLSYTLSGTTQISFTPVLGMNALDQQGGWSYVASVGGGVAVNHQFNESLSGGIYYTLAHSFTGGAANTEPGFNSQSLGVSFRKTFNSWSVGGALGVSFQSVDLSAWTPTGNLYGSKSFRWNGVVSAAYSRTEAAQVYASAGYFDQGDIAYRQRFGKKAGLSIAAGVFRTIDGSSHVHGKRAGPAFQYLLSPRVSLNAAYNYSHQSGTSANFFLGTANYFTVGVNFQLGSQAGP